MSTKHLAAGLNRAQDEDGYSAPVWAGSLQWSNTSTGEVTNSIGYVIERRGGAVFVRFRYTTARRGGEKTEQDYPVLATHTTPNYGGRRWWFVCPLAKDGRPCRRRVGKLYLPPGALYFGCRHCHELTYESTRSDLVDTIHDRMWKIRRRLGARGSVADPPPAKPRGMHWETYGRLVREYWNLQEMRQLALNLRLEQLLEGTRRALSTYVPDDGPAPLPVEWLEREVLEAWEDHKAAPDREPILPYRYARDWAASERWEDREEEKRGTLGEIARAAGVPFDFAREAQRYGLVRPDGGRGTRRKRYRRKLSSWLEKLYLLNRAGYSWEELRDWSRRRFLPGHKDEVRYPRGFSEVSPAARNKKRQKATGFEDDAPGGDSKAGSAGGAKRSKTRREGAERNDL